MNGYKNFIQLKQGHGKYSCICPALSGGKGNGIFAFFIGLFEPFPNTPRHMIEDRELLQEKRLVEQVAAGDSMAFRQLYDLSYGRVARYMQKMVGNDSLVDDILVQTYTVAWQKSASFKGNGRITTWLIGIARNIMFREFRKIKKYEPFDEEYGAADTQSQFQVEIKSTNAALKAALQTLKVKHREILELVFYQEFSYVEVAELIGIPENTVKTRVFHAKQALKDVLEKQNITDYGK